MLEPACTKRKAQRRVSLRAILVPMACLLAIALPVLAQTSSNYDLWWHVVAGGGGRMESPGYTLLGTTGQTGAASMASGAYGLSGGFWAGWTPGGGVYQVYLPLVLNRFP